MKTYIHPKGYKAEQTTSHLFDGPRYNVRIDKGVIGYNLFQFPVAEQELLDFGFIEDKKEDWKQELSKDIIKLINTCIQRKRRLIEEKDLEAVTKSIISLIDNRHNSN